MQRFCEIFGVQTNSTILVSLVGPRPIDCPEPTAYCGRKFHQKRNRTEIGDVHPSLGMYTLVDVILTCCFLAESDAAMTAVVAAPTGHWRSTVNAVTVTGVAGSIRAVANGPLGPASAGPIIVPVNKK